MNRRVLSCFKNLLRARQEAFNGDHHALSASRTAIIEEFHKNKHLQDPQHIENLLTYGGEVALVLRKAVIQAVRDEQRDTLNIKIPERVTFDPKEISAKEQLKQLKSHPDVKLDGKCCGSK